MRGTTILKLIGTFLLASVQIIAVPAHDGEDTTSDEEPKFGIIPIIRRTGKQEQLRRFFRRDYQTETLTARPNHEIDQDELEHILSNPRQQDAMDESDDDGHAGILKPAKAVLDAMGGGIGRRGVGDSTEDAPMYAGKVRRVIDAEGGLKRRQELKQISNYFDNLYYANVLMGTPGKYFSLILDTGSADLYLPSYQCSSSVCGNRARYNPGDSSTSIVPGPSATVTYGSGQASGQIAIDRLAIGGLQIPQQAFIMATKMTGHQPATIDGLMGLSFSAGSWVNYNINKTYKGRSSPIENLYKSKEIPRAAFGMWLDSAIDAAKTQVGGEIAIGSALGNPKRYTGDIRWLNVPGTKNWWTIELNNINVAGKAGVISAGRIVTGVVDSGTALIVTDYNTAATLNKQLGAYDSGIRGIWGVKCGTLRASTVKVVFTLQKMTFELSGKDLPVQVYPDDVNMCYAPFMSAAGADVTDRFILGEIFLRRFYTIYDYNHSSDGIASPRVGFATAL